MELNSLKQKIGRTKNRHNIQAKQIWFYKWIYGMRRNLIKRKKSNHKFHYINVNYEMGHMQCFSSKHIVHVSVKHFRKYLQAFKERRPI